MRRDDAAGIGHGPGTQGDGVEEGEKAGVEADTQHRRRAAAMVKPGWPRRLRQAKRTSCRRPSSHTAIQISRERSRASVMLPISRRLSSVASVSVSPISSSYALFHGAVKLQLLRQVRSNRR